MKTKNISILLFILVFAGVTLLGYTQVQAELNLGDGYCSELEKQMNMCIALGPENNPCYVIEAIDCDGEWPCIEEFEGNQVKAFHYRATANAPCNCPTWSYTITQYQICEGSTKVDYIAGSYPSGASLYKCRVSKCDDINDNAACFFDDIDEDLIATCGKGNDFQNWKLNPTLNCSTGGSIDFVIYTPLDAGVSCGNPTYIRDKNGCQATDSSCDDPSALNDVLLRGPGCDNFQIDITSFTLGAFSADLDPCTGEPLEAYIDGDPATEVLTWFSDNGCNPVDVYPDTCLEVYPLSNTGPPTGAVFKSNPSRGCIGSRCFR